MLQECVVLCWPLLALQTGVPVIRTEVTLGTFPALTIQSTTQTRRRVAGVSQYPVTTAYWLHLINSTRRETPMFWKSTMTPPIQATCWWPWVVICRAPSTAPVDLPCGSSSHRAGVSLTKVSTQPLQPLSSLVRIRSHFVPSWRLVWFFTSSRSRSPVYSFYRFLCIVIHKTLSPHR